MLKMWRNFKNPYSLMRKNWENLVINFHERAHPSGEYQLARGEPASKQEIDAVSAELDFVFPTEFVDFYSVMNGFGIHSADRGTEWFFLPLSKIRGTQVHTKEMLESHPDLGDRFVPIVDWICGDFTGYFKPKTRRRKIQLFMLSHEHLEYDAAQDPNDFLFPLCDSIKEFLTPNE